MPPGASGVSNELAGGMNYEPRRAESGERVAIMNWCKTCKKELPMSASCVVAPECSGCRAERLQHELEQAQRERDEAIRLYGEASAKCVAVAEASLNTQREHEDLRAKLLASEAAHNEAKEEIHHLQIELGQCEKKYAQSEAGGAEMRATLKLCWLDEKLIHAEEDERRISEHNKRIDHALSTSCGQSFLDERERYVKTLRRIDEENPPTEKPKEFCFRGKDADEFALEVAAWFCGRIGNIARTALHPK